MLEGREKTTEWRMLVMEEPEYRDRVEERKKKR